MRCIILLVIFLVPVFGFATEPNAPIPMAPTTVSLFTWFLGLCIMIIGYFIKRTLDHVEASSKEQWRALAGLNTRLSALEGEHKASGHRIPVIAPQRRSGDPAIRWVDDPSEIDEN